MWWQKGKHQESNPGHSAKFKILKRCIFYVLYQWMDVSILGGAGIYDRPLLRKFGRVQIEFHAK
jgi:hypothetical protein